MTARQVSLPRDSRLVALILSQYCDEADPNVVAMLTEFAHRYTTQILQDAQAYAEHSAANSKTGPVSAVSVEDVRLAIQARVDQGMSCTWPKEFLLSLAASVNKEPLPAVPESYGVRLPPEPERLTAVNFDLVPRPKPQKGDASGFMAGFGLDAEGEEDALFGGNDEDEEMTDAPNSAVSRTLTPQAGS